MKTIVIALSVIIIVLLSILFFYNPAQGPTVPGGTNSTSTGQTSMSPDGHVTVTSPQQNATIASPVSIAGTVVNGGWFFEASFPVRIFDAKGKVIGQGQAQAQSDWESTGTVPFTASITFSKPTTATGTIVLSKDNPSGMPQNDESMSIPVSFAGQSSGTGTGAQGMGTVSGKVVLGPTCPVEQNPPQPQCAPKPYQTTVSVFNAVAANPSGLVKTVKTDASGTFSITLPAGSYIFEPLGANLYPRCLQSGLITLSSGEKKSITLTCDTGIR